MRPRILLDPSATDGGGQAAPTLPDFSAELAKYKGDHGAMAAQVYQDFSQTRAELADARKKIPAEGSRVLSSDEARRFDAWLALGDPGDVARALDEGKQAVGKVRTFERKQLIADAAGLYQFKPEVLDKLAGPDLAIEVKDGQRNGKAARVAEVTITGPDGKVERMDLDKFAEKSWPEFAESLTAKKPAPANGTPSSYITSANPNPATNPANPGRSAVRSYF